MTSILSTVPRAPGHLLRWSLAAMAIGTSSAASATLCVDLTKEISIDGGSSFFDANTGNEAPVASAPSGAEYRLTIENCGDVRANEVEVSDGDLNIIGYALAPIGIGEKVVLDRSDLPELAVAERCGHAGIFTNTARVDAFSSSGNVMDTDVAVLICEDVVQPPPSLLLKKQISLDGGATFFDADTEMSAPTAIAPSGGLYRFVVLNNGQIRINEISVSDSLLGITDHPVKNLDPGEEALVDHLELPELSVAEICSAPGVVVNTAIATGFSAGTGETVSDDDPAVLVCQEEPPTGGGEGCTPGYWKQRHHFDSWVGFGPKDDFDSVFGVDSSHNKALGGALRLNGGGERALGRHAVAALLNASNADVSYAISRSGVLALVQEAYGTGDFESAKNVFEKENEQGCPLN